VLGAGFAVATVALVPFDQRIATHLQRPGFQQHAGLDHTATGFELLAIPGVFVGSGAAYLVGRLEHHRSLADVGLHVGEGTVVGAAVTEVIKRVAGRARPYVSADENPHDFGVGRGLTKGEDYRAFPSGHTTVAFAAASALTSETAHWRPHATRVVAPLAYGGATLVGLARMYHDQHWASDVALGAGVGALSGLAVVRQQHAHPRNWIDRTLLSAGVTPVPGGIAVVWSMPVEPVQPVRCDARTYARPDARRRDDR
jgi:membrane-associated phospholipid phosphatase